MFHENDLKSLKNNKISVKKHISFNNKKNMKEDNDNIDNDQKEHND